MRCPLGRARCAALVVPGSGRGADGGWAEAPSPRAFGGLPAVKACLGFGSVPRHQTESSRPVDQSTSQARHTWVCRPHPRRSPTTTSTNTPPPSRLSTPSTVYRAKRGPAVTPARGRAQALREGRAAGRAAALGPRPAARASAIGDGSKQIVRIGLDLTRQGQRAPVVQSSVAGARAAPRKGGGGARPPGAGGDRSVGAVLSNGGLGGATRLCGARARGASTVPVASLAGGYPGAPGSYQNGWVGERHSVGGSLEPERPTRDRCVRADGGSAAES